MGAERKSLPGTTRAKRSIVAICLTMAMLATSVTVLVDGALRAVTALAAIAVIFAAFRGLPEALVDSAARRRGAMYFAFIGFVLPLGAVIVSAYLVWLFQRIARSGLLEDLPFGLLIGLSAASGLLNGAVIGLNAFSRD